MDRKGETVQLAFRFALSPTPRQERMFLSHAGAARFAYNWGVERISEARTAYAEAKQAGLPKDQLPKIPDHFTLCTMWTAHKDATPELSWVGDNFTGTYQAALRDSAIAWKNYRESAAGQRGGRRVGRPRFKSRKKTIPSFQMHGTTVRVESQTRVRRNWKHWAGRANPRQKYQTLNGLGLVLPRIGRVAIMSDADRRWRDGHRDNADAERNRRRARMLRALVRTGQARISRVNINREADGLWFASATAEIKTSPVEATLAAWADRCSERGHDVDTRTYVWKILALFDEYSAEEIWNALEAAYAHDRNTAPSAMTLKKHLRAARKDEPELKGRSSALHRPPTRRQRQNGSIGVDLGVKYLAVLSDGREMNNPRLYAAALDKLRDAQRALSRTQDDSKRRERARARVARLHARVRRARAAATGRTATRLVREHAHVVVEGWDVQRTMANGDKNAPRSVRRARNMALADAARGDFRNRLTKAGPKAGCTVTVLDPHVPTGRTCSRCGSVRDKPIPPADDKFTCPSCGFVGDRRHNTARVLAGLAATKTAPSGAQPRGGSVRPEGPRPGGRLPSKRAARTQPPGRDKTGTSDP